MNNIPDLMDGKLYYLFSLLPFISGFSIWRYFKFDNTFWLIFIIISLFAGLLFSAWIKSLILYLNSNPKAAKKFKKDVTKRSVWKYNKKTLPIFNFFFPCYILLAVLWLISIISLYQIMWKDEILLFTFLLQITIPIFSISTTIFLRLMSKK